MRRGRAKAAAAVLATAALCAVAPGQAAANHPCPPPPGKTIGMFPNPLNRCEMADPGMLRTGPATWYAYVTDRGLGDGAMDVYKSVDNRATWTHVGPVLRQLPKGALNRPKTIRGKVVVPSYWAPAVYPIAGRLVLYYTVRNGSSGWNEIRAATAPGPEGPWTLRGEAAGRLAARPVVANSRYSVIDPQWFRDPRNGVTYLLWKDDLPGKQRRIVIQRMSPDGLARIGRPKQILFVDKPWEGNSVEAPSLVYRPGSGFVLFYSGNLYKALPDGTIPYAVGVARAANPGGPYVKFGPPILQGNRRFRGPGGQDVVDLGNNQWVAFYHAFPTFLPNGRYLMMDQVNWRPDGWPTISNGTPSS